MTTAETILNQLGGNKFVAMTGATNLLSSDNSLQFKIGKNASKTTHITVTLAENDTYQMTFLNVRGISIKTVKLLSGLCADQLAGMFSEVTGMATSL